MRSGYFIAGVFCLVVLSTTSFAASTDGKCRGLALEGGGTLGAFQAGAIRGLIENQEKIESNWDVVSGVSAGSLSSMAFTIHPIGDEYAATEVLFNMWHSVTKDKVEKPWPLGPKAAWFLHTGLTDTSPLRKFLGSFIEGKDFKQRPVYFSTTDINHGLYQQNFNMGMSSTDDVVSAIMSSSAIPVKFPSIQYLDQVNIDGGATMNLNMLAAINECRAQGYDDKDIIIDAVLCYGHWPGKPKAVPVKGMHTLDLLDRYKDIFTETKGNFWYAQVLEAYPDVDFRYFVHPISRLPSPPPGWMSLDFNQTHIREMLEIGQQNAKEIIEMGPVTNFQKMVNDSLEYFHEQLQGFTF